MRFDDSLRTVLASDAGAGFGAEATWRQLVDLIGRGKVVDAEEPVRRLRELRGEVGEGVRAASARALAFARPPAALVALFAEDELAIAAPVLRTAALDEKEWLALLPELTPRGRSVLRHRRDLSPAVMRGLENFGSVDFILGHEGAGTVATMPVSHDAVAAEARSHREAPPEASSGQFEAPRSHSAAEPQRDDPSDADRADPIVALFGQEPSAEQPAAPPPVAASLAGEPERFEIADLVARIDAFHRDRPDIVAPVAANDTAVAAFAFRSDAAGVVRWVEGGERAALVGRSLRAVDAAGFADRARIDAAIALPGDGAMAGAWRLTADPVFDAFDGRFSGYRGEGRRPPAAPDGRAASEALRQLVHELRTPTNAIAGFAELIETQLLGPVAPPYRDQAGTIRTETAALIGAIDDLDTAARLTGQALDLSAAVHAIGPVVARAVRDLADDRIQFQDGGGQCAMVDGRALERLLRRLFAALLAVAAPGERLRVRVKDKGGDVAVQVDRPAALTVQQGRDGALSRHPQAGVGGPLLGIDFAIDLARDFAAALGGSLTIGGARLTLRLPAALNREVGQAAE